MPLLSAGELIRSVPNSPNKEMGDAALRRSCVRLVRKERREINTVLLEGVNVDHSVETWRSYLMLYGSVMQTIIMWSANTWWPIGGGMSGYFQSLHRRAADNGGRSYGVTSVFLTFTNI